MTKQNSVIFSSENSLMLRLYCAHGLLFAIKQCIFCVELLVVTKIGFFSLCSSVCIFTLSIVAYVTFRRTFIEGSFWHHIASFVHFCVSQHSLSIFLLISLLLLIVLLLKFYIYGHVLQPCSTWSTWTRTLTLLTQFGSSVLLKMRFMSCNVF